MVTFLNSGSGWRIREYQHSRKPYRCASFNLNMLRLVPNLFLPVVLVISMLACDRVKTKGHQIADKSREAIKEKKDNLADKIVTRFDSNTADTKFNKRRLAEFFKFEPPPDVKELYCYARNYFI